MMGWGKAQNTQILFRAEIISGKYQFGWFLAIKIPVCQIQMTLTLIPFQKQHDGMGKSANTQILFRAEIISGKYQFGWFLAITIPVRQIQMIVKLIPLQNQHVGMGICA